MTAGLKRDDEADRMAPGLAQRIGRYRLVEQLGEGGMGVVHLALDPSGRAVAIKVLREHIAHDPDARSRLTREVWTLARVQDARVATVLDADTEGPRPYIVTRYIPGPSLDQVVSEHGPLHGEALLRLGRGLADALYAIHGAGVIHRDLKPANVVLLDGDPVIIDFGIAHVADDIRLTMTGLVMGTPGYLSPEVVEGGPVTEATDWWGWAATLVFAASGAPPFGRGPMHVVLDRVRHGQADLSGVDDRLAPLLAAALSPHAVERPHADEIVKVLDRYAAGASPTLAVPVADPSATQEYPGEPSAQPARPDLPGEWPSRRGTLLALMLVVLGVAANWPLVALGLVAGWSWSARLTDRSMRALAARRQLRGRRRSDIPVAVLAGPWHLVAAAVATVLNLLVPAVVAACSAFSIALAVAALAGGEPEPGRSLPLAGAGLLGLLMAWWGPGGASLQRGSGSLLRTLTPAKGAAELAASILLLAAVALAAWAWFQHGQPGWWPWSSSYLPNFSGFLR